MLDDIKEFVMIALLMVFAGVMYIVAIGAALLLMAAPFIAVGLGIAGMIEIIGWAIG